ncbi:MAG TPA: hypothetical protein VM867_01305, partial [Xanthobacteraceae bacterium]|nr:hypothetical protein [Xanthobacteraceae bacterium]
IFISALIHVVLLTAVAVPRKHATAHGETVMVDLVPVNEAPESVQKEPEHEAAPPPLTQPAAPQSPQAENVAPRAPEPPQRQPPLQPQAQQQQQSAPPQQPPPAQPQQQATQRPPPPQTTTPWPEPQEPKVRVGQESLMEQGERLAALMNLPGPNTGGGTGAEAVNKAHLTQTDVDALRAHLKSCWKLPAGVAPNLHLKMVVRMSLRQDGGLAAEPALVEAGLAPEGPALVREAMRAIKQCEPYKMLPREKYREWRVLDIDFSPDKMG